jgi:osmotically-inducible protein OsmY
MMAVATDPRTDEQIREDVLAELKWEPPVQPNEIGVTVKNGVVTLTGFVDSYTKKYAAQEAAHRVRGVKAVANDIEVPLPAVAERTDADVAAAAVRALEMDASVPIDNLDITVSKGWVTLRGEVGRRHQREEAYKIVHNLAGVKGVTNLIVVRR